jgi:hypothetical protein
LWVTFVFWHGWRTDGNWGHNDNIHWWYHYHWWSVSTYRIIDRSCKKYPWTQYDYIYNICNCPGDMRWKSSWSRKQQCNTKFSIESPIKKDNKKTKKIKSSCTSYPWTSYRESDKMCACINDKIWDSSWTTESKCGQKKNLPKTDTKKICEKYPWTWYRESDKMCACANDKIWVSSWTEKSQCLLSSHKHNEVTQIQCDQTYSWTIYSEASKSCICPKDKWIQSLWNPEFLCQETTTWHLFAQREVILIQQKFDHLTQFLWKYENLTWTSNEVMILMKDEPQQNWIKMGTYKEYKTSKCTELIVSLDLFNTNFSKIALSSTLDKHYMLYQNIESFCINS